jgi:predicted porin
LANTKGQNGSQSSSINTGLLPSWLGVTGKSRQNDLDVSWTISLQPGASTAHGLQGGGGSEFRQAQMTFGDKSWGTIKIGKDLGTFGADAILNDQTLLGVGSQGLVGATGGTTTTLGRIGTGFLYADFKGQINYTTPNWNGFQGTIGIEQPWTTISGAGPTGNQKSPAFSGVASYAFTGDFSGKVWGEFWTQKAYGIGATPAVAAGFTFDPVLGSVANVPAAATAGKSDTAHVFGIGGKVDYSGFGLVGYYYDGSGVGTTDMFFQGYSAAGEARDSNGGYIQGSFTIPTVGTKIAASWGESSLDLASGEAASTLVDKNEMWTIGAYHPLTKSINLVAEYSDVKASNHIGQENKSHIFDLGAILFF